MAASPGAYQPCGLPTGMIVHMKAVAKITVKMIASARTGSKPDLLLTHNDFERK